MSQCRISYDSKGVATVVNEEGKPSKLYKKILDLVGDQDASINAWSAAVDPESGLNGEETTITSLMNFMDSTVSISSKLTPEETLNIRNIMSENGFESMSDFNSVMIGLFKPNGYIELPERDNTGRRSE